MKIAIASDDIYPVAKFIMDYLKSKGFEVTPYASLKTGKSEPWPNVAYEVAKAVAQGKYDYGIIICYTGTGVSIVANKVKGIRAALCFDAKSAEGARLWNNANILALSARLTSEEIAKEIINSWFSVKEMDPTEKRNIDRVKKIEEQEFK